MERVTLPPHEQRYDHEDNNAADPRELRNEADNTQNPLDYQLYKLAHFYLLSYTEGRKRTRVPYRTREDVPASSRVHVYADRAPAP